MLSHVIIKLTSLQCCCSLTMKILLIILVALASRLVVISTTYAEKKGSEENPLNFSLQEGHQGKEQNRISHKASDLDRKVDGGIRGPYVNGHKNLVEKMNNVQVAKSTDDDEDDHGSGPSRGSSTDTHRQIKYDDLRKLFHDIQNPSP